MGVRCHKFLKGEDQLYFASLAASQPTLLDLDEKSIPGPDVDQRRDGSGSAASDYVDSAF
jgi:DNA gyrase subunit A